MKLVVSTLPGTTKDQLIKRSWKTLEVQPLTQAERKTLVIEYLSMSGKSLTENQLNLIISSPQCENPLFLRYVPHQAPHSFPTTPMFLGRLYPSKPHSCILQTCLRDLEVLSKRVVDID